MCLCLGHNSIVVVFFVFFFKQKTAYEMRISDWSSDVCSSDLSSTAATRDQAATDGVSVLEVCSAADSSENLATKPDSGGRPVISRAQATKDMPRKARAAGMATPTTSSEDRKSVV